MSNENVSIGKYEIVSCFLKKWDGSNEKNIANLITEFAFTESIEDQAVNGYIIVLDAVGLIDTYPVIGEEILEIKYKDTYENEKSGKYHIYRMDNNQFDFQGQKQAYILKFHSLDFIRSESLEIRKSYRGEISQSVQDIFDEYFDKGGKELDKEDTTNEATVVVPAMTPWQTINLFTKKAYSDESQSSNFVFFENRDKFHFKTYEKLFEEGRTNVDEKKTFRYYDPRVDSSDRVRANMQSIRDFRLLSRFDLVGELRSGSMLNETIVLDLATKTFEEIVYKHNDEFSNYEHTDTRTKDYHTSDFIENYFHEEDNLRKSFVVFDDTTLEPLGNETKYSDILPRRVATSYYMGQIVMNGKMYGRNDIVAGDVIKLELPKFRFSSEDDSTNENLSGYWLIKTINHTMKENVWEMDVTLIKDSYKDGV
jgi:hypothetical protein